MRRQHTVEPLVPTGLVATAPGAALEPSNLRRVFSAHPSGVMAVAALVDERPVGLAASSFTSVSLDPPLVSLCMAQSSGTWQILGRAPRLGLSVLSAGQELVGRQLAARGTDRFARFAGLNWSATPQGAVLVEAASAWLDCSVEQRVPAGDHELVLLRIHDARSDPRSLPLVFHGSRFTGLRNEFESV